MGETQVKHVASNYADGRYNDSLVYGEVKVRKNDDGYLDIYFSGKDTDSCEDIEFETTIENEYSGENRALYTGQDPEPPQTDEDLEWLVELSFNNEFGGETLEGNEYSSWRYWKH